MLVVGSVFGGAPTDRSSFDFDRVRPASKAPVEVVVRKNPFQPALEPERPLPIIRHADDPVMKLGAAITPRIRSVLRKPRALLLLKDQVLQPGDEVRAEPEAAVPKYRVVLRSIEEDRLVFHLASLDPQRPDQVEAAVPLPPSMRSNQ
jgi:hypothetical protein